MTKLNQVIAIEKGTRSRVQKELTEIYKTTQKTALFGGFVKVYERLSEDTETVPPSSAKVQAKVPALLNRVQEVMRQLLDVSGQRDLANTQAKADIEVGGEVLLRDVPATFLLFVEKRLVDLHTLVSSLPTLDPSEEWSWDEPRELWTTKPTQTARTKKVQRPIVLQPPTTEHPAQTALITEDVYVGDWLQTKHSGATTEAKRRQLLGRIEALQEGVKFARERANMVEAPEVAWGEALSGWIFR
jgi:hypothetical protein